MGTVQMHGNALAKILESAMRRYVEKNDLGPIDEVGLAALPVSMTEFSTNALVFGLQRELEAA